MVPRRADAPREPRGGLDKNALLTGEAPLAGHFVGHPGHWPRDEHSTYLATCSKVLS